MSLENRHITKSGKAKIKFHAKNSFFLPISYATAQFEFENQLHKERDKIDIETAFFSETGHDIGFEFAPRNCGIINISVKKILLYDFFKIFKVRLKPKFSEKLVVLPNIIDLNGKLDLSSSSSSDNTRFSEVKSGDDPSQIFGFKEYEHGDKINRIHWKLSSKSDTLWVKEYSLPIDSKTLLAFNIGDKSSIDTIYSAVISVSDFLTKCDIPHNIHCQNNDVLCTINNQSDISESMETLLSQGFDDAENAYFSGDNIGDCSQVIYFTSSKNLATAEILSKACNISILDFSDTSASNQYMNIVNATDNSLKEDIEKMLFGGAFYS